MSFPFEGITVLEYAGFVAGPYCGRLLSDLGAEVIKIEAPGTGDPARGFGPFPGNIPHREKSGLFLHLSLNKRSITLDPSTPSGKGLFLKLAATADVRLRRLDWVRHVSLQVARATRMMHDQGFTHNDLKWRNLLVDDQALANVYLIDCPAGSFWWGPMLRYRIIKDLACLDKLAKHHLSRSGRLAFYKMYLGKARLDTADRKQLRAILAFFEGRE